MYEGSGVELAKRIGLAWGHGDRERNIPPTVSGSVVTMTVTPAGLRSPILQGFPRKFDLHDELYWPLTGDSTSITTLVTAEAAPSNRYPQDGPRKAEEMDGKKWPVMWTKEVGKGKVFATIAGHNFFAFNDPYFREVNLIATKPDSSMRWAQDSRRRIHSSARTTVTNSQPTVPHARDTPPL